MSVQLKRGESFNLTTGKVERIVKRSVPAKTRPASGIKSNDLRALSAFFGKAN